jgi:hypothetical protein
MILLAVVTFDPERVAYFEAAGWRAYYDHRWLAVVVLMVRLCQEQFRIPFPLSLVAAYHVARASIAWAPAANDPVKTERHLLSFYRLARRYSGLKFEPAHAAALELRYWAEHRRLVGQPDKTGFVNALIDLHAHLFSISAEAARESAEYRVEASNTVDRITGRLSTNPEADWRALEADLRRCYRSIVTAQNAHSG